MLPVVVSQTFEVSDRLNQFGLSQELLIGAVKRGFLARLNCTQNHPPSLPGMLAWAETVCALRESLIPLGWERFNLHNLPLTVCRATNIAVGVSSGDESTGRADATPRTRNAKGMMTKQVVDTNCFQLGLFADMPIVPTDLSGIDDWASWLLLTHIDTKARLVRCELSRPVNIGIDGRVDGWAERIMVNALPFDTDDVHLTSGADNGEDSNGKADGDIESESIHIDIRRRA